MKALHIVLLSLLPIATLQAQSLEETQSWILEQDRNNLTDLSHSIEDGEFISTLRMPSLGSAGGGEVKRSVPLAQIKTISYVHTDEYLSFVLQCAQGDACVYQVVNDSDGNFESEERREKLLFELYKKLDASFPKRMEKALLHLIKLSGGSAKAVPFVKKKEAF
jgi:hypothetical protein